MKTNNDFSAQANLRSKLSEACRNKKINVYE